MKCREAHKHLQSKVLGELDREVEEGLGAHVKECAGCREVEHALARTVLAIEAVPKIPPSVQRRARTVQAMNEAYERHVLSRVSRAATVSWPLRMGVAAVVLVAFSVGVVLTPREAPREPALTVTQSVFEGQRAFIQRPQEAFWREIERGMIVYEGDRISGSINAKTADGTSISSFNDTEFMVASASPLKLSLASGRLNCTTESAMAVVGPGGERIETQAGRESFFEASLKPLVARPTEGSWRLEDAVAIVEKRTKSKVGIDARLKDEGVRINFDPDGTDRKLMLEQLGKELGPDILVLPTGDGHIIVPTDPPRTVGNLALHVLVRNGSGALIGSREGSEVPVMAGETSRVNSRGLALAPKAAYRVLVDDDRAQRTWHMTLNVDDRKAIARFQGTTGVMKLKGRSYWFQVVPGAEIKLDPSSMGEVKSVSMQMKYGIQ